ncbi:hypothetical protein C8J57DRAFT_1038852, partial [Mycena rebaudengoi]
DTETAFWNAYKTLVGEHDRGFLEKYSTDLDASLIFASNIWLLPFPTSLTIFQAGLFSAVRSAFIIQIQPELRQDPNDATQDLLRLSIHSSNSSLFPNANTSTLDKGPPSDIVFAQSLLYISLCCTLLAAPFAVLGKQW